MTDPRGQWSREDLDQFCGSRHLRLLFAFTGVVIAIVGGAIGLVMMEDSTFRTVSTQWQQAMEVRVRLLEQQNARVEERMNAMIEILRRIDESHGGQEQPASGGKRSSGAGITEK